MVGKITTAPALIWRALFILALAGASALAAAGPGAPTSGSGNYLQFGKADQKEGTKILEKFRQTGFLGYFEFDLVVLPRRGDERRYHGRMWAGQNAQGNIFRLILAEGTPDERRLLIQSGPAPAIWSWSPGKGVSRIGLSAFFEPMLPGTELTPFDLQMPFLYWKDFSYEGLNRVRGRPASTFVFLPPPEIKGVQPGLGGVRVQLDGQFNAPMESELLDPQGDTTKSMTLLDLKKVKDDWIVKAIDFRNEKTRDKTRFAITGAAPGETFQPMLFEPAQLDDAIAGPPRDRVTAVDQ